MLWWADIEVTVWELRATGLRNYLQLEVPYRELRAKTITGYRHRIKGVYHPPTNKQVYKYTQC